MPRIFTELRVFVASPSDLPEERALIATVIDELNITYSTNNIKLEYIGWETHIYPAVGDDAQDVVNTQLNDDYDILIGMMWGKFGTPTKRESSGTKEEFERAYSRHLKNPKEVSIFFYFKNAPIPVDKIEPSAISAINEFKSDLQSRGLLTGHFNAPDEFEKLVKLHLARWLNDYIKDNSVLQEIKEGTGTALIISDTPTSESIIQIEEEEEGFFECLDKSNEYMSEMSLTLAKMTKYISDLGTSINKRTAKIDSLKTATPDVKEREIRKVLDLSAEDMIKYYIRTKPEIAIMNDQFNNGIRYFTKSLTILNTFDQDQSQINTILTSVLALRSGLIHGIEGMDSMNNSIKVLPSMTTKLAKAKKETNKVLTSVIDEFISYLNVLDELSKSFNYAGYEPPQLDLGVPENLNF